MCRVGSTEEFSIPDEQPQAEAALPAATALEVHVPDTRRKRKRPSKYGEAIFEDDTGLDAALANSAGQNHDRSKKQKAGSKRAFR